MTARNLILSLFACVVVLAVVAALWLNMLTFATLSACAGLRIVFSLASRWARKEDCYLNLIFLELWLAVTLGGVVVVYSYLTDRALPMITGSLLLTLYLGFQSGRFCENSQPKVFEPDCCNQSPLDEKTSVG
jgi:hypothetical protein